MKRRTSAELIARAYAILGLPPGSSRRDAARQHKRLVKRWHPDQYANDPQGQAEAAQRMREINVAFALIRQASARQVLESAAQAWPEGEPPARPTRVYPGQRLSDAELDEIAAAIGSPQYFVQLSRYAFWAGAIVFGSLAMFASPRGRDPRVVNVLAGLTLLSAAAGPLIYTVWFKKR